MFVDVNGSLEPQIDFCLVEVFRFLFNNILYLVVFAVIILYSEDELFQMSNWTGRPKVRKHGGMWTMPARFRCVGGEVRDWP